MHIGNKRWLAAAIALTLLTALALPTTGIAKTKATSVEPQVVWTAFPDAYEPSDDSTTTAPMLPEKSFHTFDTDDDVDWCVISAETTGHPFVIETVLEDGMELDTMLAVYDEEGMQLRYDDDSDIWDTYGSTIYFTAPAPGTYYVEAGQLSDGYLGAYWLYVTDGIARRIAGSNRYATAAECSKTIYSGANIPTDGDGPNAVVLANGLNFPDAIAGSVLAMELDTSLVLTNPFTLSGETAEEINRLAAGEYWDEYGMTVYVLGSEAAVSEEVFDELLLLPHVTDVQRVSGSNRFQTAVEIAKETSETAGGLSSRAFIVNGMNFPDALAAGPVAWHASAPVLMVTKDDAPSVTLNYLQDNGIDDVYVVGSEAAISAACEAEIASVLPSGTADITRVEGDDRFETAVELAELGMTSFGMTADSISAVNGLNFPDGLAAAPLSAWTGGPLLLTRPDNLSMEVIDFYDTYGPTTGPSYVIGGPPAVNDDAYRQFRSLWVLDLP